MEKPDKGQFRPTCLAIDGRALCVNPGPDMRNIKQHGAGSAKIQIEI